MMRSLWTAASGMAAQQIQVDTISNNLANVNTTGYKQESVNFKSLLYQNLQTDEQIAASNNPTPLQVGHGVRVGTTDRSFSQGTFITTDLVTDMAIQGNGFFSVLNGEEVTYTRDGSFRLSYIEGGGTALVTSNGYPVLSAEGEPIIFEPDMNLANFGVDDLGNMYYLDRETNTTLDLGSLMIVQFANPQGLSALGGNQYGVTAASGEPLLEGEVDGLVRSTIRTGVLEASNVNIATEMVNLIVAQRAYELNSTSIQTADEMLQQANQLKRL
ncbi:MAG: hypothetical protein ATN35_00175 [Epulopiscium sp. Nele67-Bin004]|nr:MAG: hypothetical protein ATN35_00175 [Epulopiscium sp. Nele67-Bin004]